MAVLPLLMTLTFSWEVAQKSCRTRRLSIGTSSSLHKFDDWADASLLPMHIWNCVAMATSCVCFSLWLHRSPHRFSTNASDRILDKSLFSFFSVQLFANILRIGTSMHMCVSTVEAVTLMGMLNHMASIGVSIICTNLLAHRYFLRRAQAVDTLGIGATKLQGTAKSLLKILHSSFMWERRVLLVVAAGVALHVMEGLSSSYRLLYNLSLICGALGSIAVFITDLIFSTISISIFIYFISRALGSKEKEIKSLRTHLYKGRRRVRVTHMQTVSQRFDQEIGLLKKVKLATLIGCVLCVCSSSVLYINGFYAFLWAEWCAPYAWCHPYVFGLNIDSILNDVGLVLASGILIFSPKRERKSSRFASSSRRW